MRRCARSTLLLLLLCAAHLARGRDLPQYIKACSEKDPNMSECALNNGRAAIPYLVKGDPSIKLLPQDPLEVTEIVVDEKGLKFTMRDVVIRGEAKGGLQDARSFPSERRLELDVWFPVLDMSFKYNVSGKVLVLPLDGAGTGTMKLENVTIHYKINYEPYRNGDTDYIKATVAQSRGEIGHMALNLQNLFNGDKFLGDNTNKVLNENWEVLIGDVGPAMFESFRAVAQNVVDTIFDGVPYRKVILE
ncbi:protein takeout-like isoform X3 [Schistocerca cancellata]|uniref:protein takeout-like isoform X3 n=1 Tax=Schistocerca cancellata TaxID=274614 RepID=UPI002118BF42|nr:protein takeout-like isoform X3 [Schistocerca cancellata]